MNVVDGVAEGMIAELRMLFEEYWSSFGFTPCFQGFGEELAALPAGYDRLWLALENGEPAGCVALRRLDEVRAEFKRLYVRPQFRGSGLGRQLLTHVITAAREAGFRELVCDTMPVMQDALSMYRRGGFDVTGPYTETPTPGAIYLRLAL